MAKQSRIFKPKHLLPSDYWLDYILLPYGEYYKPSQDISKAMKGDILRFFNGPETAIERVMKIPQDEVCDLLCRMRYGISWSVAFKRWQSYVVLEGNDRNVLSKDICLLVVYERVSTD